MPCDFFCLQLEEGKICKSHQIYNTLRLSVVCASAVVYYYFQGFSAGHKRIISYSSTWQKYFFFPPFQRWTQVNVIMTWFIIIWMDDGELIGFDGASCNAAYGTKYKLTGGCLRWSGKKSLSCDSVVCSLNHLQTNIFIQATIGKALWKWAESGNESRVLAPDRKALQWTLKFDFSPEIVFLLSIFFN